MSALKSLFNLLVSCGSLLCRRDFCACLALSGRKKTCRDGQVKPSFYRRSERDLVAVAPARTGVGQACAFACHAVLALAHRFAGVWQLMALAFGGCAFFGALGVAVVADFFGIVAAVGVNPARSGRGEMCGGQQSSEDYEAKCVRLGHLLAFAE